MDTRKYTESKYITIEFVKSLKDTTFTILDEGEPVLDTFGERHQLHIQFKENAKIKEWKPNIKSIMSWQKHHGMDSKGWVSKQGMIVIETNERIKKEIMFGYPIGFSDAATVAEATKQ